MSKSKDEGKVRHTKDKLKDTLEKYDLSKLEFPQFLDLYNQSMATNGVSGTIHTRISEGNYWYVVDMENKKEINLKRGYACEVSEEQLDTDEVDIIGNYSKSDYGQTAIVGKNGISHTVTDNHGQVTAITQELRIRKLTPRECYRLMGFSDLDYDRAKEVISSSMLYHTAGDL